jgi:hypothetical protein
VNSDQTFAIVITLVVVTLLGFVKILRGPIGEAIGRRISGSEATDESDRELSDLRARVAELEERVEFTERVLLQQPERGPVHAEGGSR